MSVFPAEFVIGDEDGVQANVVVLTPRRRPWAYPSDLNLSVHVERLSFDRYEAVPGWDPKRANLDQVLFLAVLTDCMEESIPNDTLNVVKCYHYYDRDEREMVWKLKVPNLA